jgi:putative flippase GtrA
MPWDITTLRTQFFRYFITSGIALIVDFGTLIFLVQVMNFHYILAAAIGFIFGLCIVYILSLKWVFGPASSGNIVGFTVFTVIGVLGLGLNELLMWILVEYICLHYTIAKIFTIGFVFLFNFIARKKFVFS